MTRGSVPTPDFDALARRGAEEALRISAALTAGLQPDVSRYELEVRDRSAAERLKEAERQHGPAPYGVNVGAPSDLERAHAAFQAVPPDHGRRLPHDNGLQAGRTCLYVGKCAGRRFTVGARMWQHFGYGHAGTYALNLSHWPILEPLKVSIWIARYRDLPRGVIERLEDALWDLEQPCLGQRGGR